jgi:glycolate oxidase
MGKPEVLRPSVQPALDKADLLRRLSAALPPECVLHEREDLVPYECDGLSAHAQVPLVVALPENEQQVCEVLRICSQARVPVVARGAGTGLSGGAMPHEQGVTLTLSKLKSILAIDPAARTARVQPGVRNLAISEAASVYGLYYAPDPSSQIACSIGGNVAENSGGVHCLKYGLTGHNLLKLRFVTIDGPATICWR